MLAIDQRLNTCTLADIQRGRRAGTSAIPRLAGAGLVLGRARTVVSAPGDILGVMEAIDAADPDDILILKTSGAGVYCLLGDNMAFAAQVRGVRGFVVDGFVRDLEGIRELGLSVHARGIEMSGATATGTYTLDEPVDVDRVSIRAGDYVALDDDGIAVIPAEILEDVLSGAEAAVLREHEVRTLLRAGVTLREANNTVGIHYGEGENGRNVPALDVCARDSTLD